VARVRQLIEDFRLRICDGLLTIVTDYDTWVSSRSSRVAF